MKLNKIVIQNFKGIEYKELEFNDINEIYGKNAKRKTSVYDAFLWCLFGYDSQDQTNFQIKPFDSDKKTKTTVICHLDKITLKKECSEKWVKKQKTRRLVLDGLETNYFVDGKSINKTKYKATVEEIIDIKIFRLLTDVRYFNESLSWKERRDILFSLYDIDESKIEGFDDIVELLCEEGFEKSKSNLNDELKDINEEIDGIEPRIKEIRSFIKEVEESDLNIDELSEKKKQIELKIQDIQNDSGEQEKRNRLAKIENEIQTKRNIFQKSKNDKLKTLQDSIEEYKRMRSNLSDEIEILTKDFHKQESIMENNQQELVNLRGQFSSILKEKIQIDEICPICEKPFEASKIREITANMKQKRAEKLEAINEQGTNIKLKNGEIYEASLKIKTVIEKKSIQKDELFKKIEGLQKDYDSILAKEPDLSDLEEQKEKLSSDDNKIISSDLESYKSQLQEIEKQIEIINDTATIIKNNKDYQERISEIQEEEVSLINKQTEILNKIDKINIFITNKTLHIEKEVSKLFKIATFKLFHQNYGDNDTQREVCETMVNGVIYNSLNNAMKIQVGIDIIKTLQDHYDFRAPLWIDNRESVTTIPDLDCQIISLYVLQEFEGMTEEEVKEFYDKFFEKKHELTPELMIYLFD